MDRRISERFPATITWNWINQVPLGYVGNPRLAPQDTADKFMDAVAADFIKVAREVAAYRIGIDV